MNPNELEKLLLRYGPALQLYAAGWCQWPEDCVQEAFIKLALAEPPPDAPVPWLFRVVKNEALGSRRAEVRRAKREHAASALDSANQPRQRTQLQGAIGTGELVDALDSLSAESREVVVARFWGELNFEDIGRRTNNRFNVFSHCERLPAAHF